jgi:hypothetical protein
VRTRAALLVVGAAATLGILIGAVVLPDREDAAGGQPSPTIATPGATSPSASSAGPVRSENLLTTTDFDDVGLTVTPERSDVRLEVVVCEKEETLDDVALSGPPLQQLWQKGRVVASEQAIAARDAAEATDVAKRVLRKLEACQVEVATHWVYGPTHTERVGPGTTASWLGMVNGKLNTSGSAPKGEKISGGIAVLRHDSHVAVFNINWCASAGDSPACVVAGPEAYGQLAELSRAAARRLG